MQEYIKNKILWVGAAGFMGFVTLLFAIYFTLLRPQYVSLYENMRIHDVANIVHLLEEAGIRYRLNNEGSSVLVPAHTKARARLATASTDRLYSAVEGFELFDQTEMGLTDFAQKIKFQRAIQGELARTLMLIQGVDEARVHVSIPERRMFAGNQTEVKAAISLSLSPGQTFSLNLQDNIKALISAAIPDLHPENVTIIRMNGDQDVTTSQSSLRHELPSETIQLRSNARGVELDTIELDPTLLSLMNQTELQQSVLSDVFRQNSEPENMNARPHVNVQTQISEVNVRQALSLGGLVLVIGGGLYFYYRFMKSTRVINARKNDKALVHLASGQAFENEEHEGGSALPDDFLRYLNAIVDSREGDLKPACRALLTDIVKASERAKAREGTL